MDALDLREILVKKPFKRITPLGSHPEALCTDGAQPSPDGGRAIYQVVTQNDFLREYEPSGHMINDPILYPDKVRKDPETGKEYTEHMARCAFAFQRIISVKQLTHLCGNDIQFETPSAKEDKIANDNFFKFREGWAVKNMEVAWYESAKSVKLTGDGAFVGYKKNGKFYWKVLSYLNGDRLFPHYDSVTGDLTLFARQYDDMDDEGNSTTTYVEVWDETYLYRFKRDSKGMAGVMTRIKERFGISGYKLISKEKHSFPFIPVAYKRDENGACWTFSQDSINQYELGFSQLVQNNTAYAFPIMYMKGDDIALVGDMTGAVKGVSMGPNDDAGFLNQPNGSDLFSIQLNTLYKHIFEASFCVTPPEVKSGDLPGVAVKLLYAPAIEFAMKDAEEYDAFITDMVKIYSEGYGTEIKNNSGFNMLNVYSWILPFVPQNDSETINNLATAVQNGFLSKQSASDKIPMYAKNSEWERIMKEMKEEQQHDILLQTAPAEPQEPKEPNE